MSDERRTEASVQRVREQSFEDYYRNHRERMLRALALTLGDPDLAAEATDEAMVRTYQHWKKVRRYANPPGWTYRVGLNWARSRLRKTKREQPGEIPDQPRFDPLTGDPKLMDHIGRLAMPARTVVVMRYYLHWSNNEIAEALDVPVGTIKSRLHRALAELRDKLEERR